MSGKFNTLNYPTVVIVGGGFAGLELAKKLDGQKFKVFLLDRNNYHTFQPLLYQVATGGLGSDAIAYPLRKVIGPMPNVAFRMADVSRVIPEENRLETSVGVFEYDYLVMATGSSTNFFQNESIQQHSMPIKSVPHALDIRSYLLQEFEKALVEHSLENRQKALNFVIVGGGPTGVELAGAMAEIRKNVLPSDYTELDPEQMKVYLLEAGSKLLGPMSAKSSQAAKVYLEKLGVEVRLNTLVTGYDGNELKLKEQDSLFVETVIWSAGVMGAIPEGIPSESLIRGNRVLVNEYNQLSAFPNVFVLGDAAGMVLPEYPNGHPMVAPVAIQQAKLLARNLGRLASGRQMKPFVYRDKGSMATIGRNKAVVDLPKFRFKGWFAWIVWMFVHLLMLVGFRNRLVVLLNWAWNYLSYERAIRLIIRPYIKKH